jgi:hypothetical protein
VIKVSTKLPNPKFGELVLEMFGLSLGDLTRYGYWKYADRFWREMHDSWGSLQSEMVGDPLEDRRDCQFTNLVEILQNMVFEYYSVDYRPCKQRHFSAFFDFSDFYTSVKHGKDYLFTVGDKAGVFDDFTRPAESLESGNYIAYTEGKIRNGKLTSVFCIERAEVSSISILDCENLV